MRPRFDPGSFNLFGGCIKNSFNSYPLDRLALAGAKAAYEDEAWFRHPIRASLPWSTSVH